MAFLLSPAGNSTCLVAAVQNGADEVYLGLSDFNARAGAENFTLESLAPWVRYAHVRGTKIHVTLNTLLKAGEMDRAVELAEAADKLGVDAFIVQDLGLVSRLAGKIGAQLHASTQMTVMNRWGIRQMADLGFSRVVLARELSLGEIQELSSLGLTETEAFCHGALCMSYSGQCMLSFAQVGRSGNRGTCSQPCRLPYSRGTLRNRNLLSPKDLMTLPYLKQLTDTGVTSLKIEGRLKSPEYVAAVTAAYRRSLDNPDRDIQEDADRLSVIFSRGFCSGHQLGKLPQSDVTLDYAGRTGLPCGRTLSNFALNRGSVTTYRFKARLTAGLSVGDGITFFGFPDNGGVVNVIETKGTRSSSAFPGSEVVLTVCGNPPPSVGNTTFEFYKTLDFTYNKEIRQTFETTREFRKVPISAFLAVNSQEAVLTLSDGKNVAEAHCPVTSTDTLPSDFADKAKEILGETGSTPFAVRTAQVSVSEGFVTYSTVKKLRREASEILENLRAERGRQ